MPADLKSQVFDALLSSWGFIVKLAPYLIGGILVAALVNTFVSRHRSARLLSSTKWWMLPVSGLVGMASPACTYGTVPLFMELVRGGAPMAPAATFLVASSLVNPQMFLLTFGALGIWVAVAQAVASLAFAVGIGALVARVTGRGVDIEGSEIKAARSSEQDQSVRAGKHDKMMQRPWPRRFVSSAIDLAEFVGFYFVIGALVASFVLEFLPRGWMLEAVGQGRWWSAPFAAVVSIPVYVCGGGTIPFIARAHEMGMSAGAVLAFLIAGPATRITALSALAVIFKKRAVVVYVLLVLVFSVLMGALLGAFVQNLPPVAAPPSVL